MALCTVTLLNLLVFRFILITSFEWLLQELYQSQSHTNLRRRGFIACSLAPNPTESTWELTPAGWEERTMIDALLGHVIDAVRVAGLLLPQLFLQNDSSGISRVGLTSEQLAQKLEVTLSLATHLP